MTAYNSARPGDSQVAIGKVLRLEFTLEEPRGSRRFVNDKGETIQVSRSRSAERPCGLNRPSRRDR